MRILVRYEVYTCQQSTNSHNLSLYITAVFKYIVYSSRGLDVQEQTNCYGLLP